ncbi:hypothetical protein ANCDUO_24196, partial [Ancylostoma duodenale]
INGHSLGGALASLAAFSVINDSMVAKEKLTLLTLGQPRVGDKTFAEAYNKQVMNSFRVVRAGDSMPYLPKEEAYTYHRVEILRQKGAAARRPLQSDWKEMTCTSTET